MKETSEKDTQEEKSSHTKPSEKEGKGGKVFDGYNSVMGGILAGLSYTIGTHWILFALYLLFNVLDFLSGWMKSKILGTENSLTGLKGVLKKMGYWILIALAFGASQAFIEIGDIMEIDLEISTLLGWFVLASLMVNEFRSICENFLEAGFDIPNILLKALNIADRAINHTVEKEDDGQITRQ